MVKFLEMARTITDEEIKLSIIVNGNPAQKQLLDLEKSTRKVTEEKKALQIELRRVETALGKDSAEYKKLSAEIKVCTTTIDNNKAAMKELQNQIGITGLTIGQLQSKATQLKLSLRNVVPGSEDYKRYEAELKQVNTRLSELSGKAKEAKYSLSSLADGFNKYAALGASVIAMFTGVVLSLQKMIDYNGKLADTQADVMKTTGMTKKEVDELTKSFGLLETRTSRIDLLKIAEQGGRIGIAKEEIGSFVAVMDKASVALGDSFTGGVEEVANKLGKLKFLFQETKDMSVDQAYNSIGSAINDLGANGVASEANIADFATRLGSLTDVLKPTIRETLALGAAFEESGIESEVSARAYNIFMKQASTESAKFAKVMGISQKSVENMINTNPLDFMLKFAEGMKGMDATNTAKTLDYLGINADGANKVIGAMGNNLGRFRELIDLSNNSFESGTSLIAEYNIKNETLGATLEKISKKVTGAFSSEALINWLTSAVQWIGKFVGATQDADGSVARFKNSLIFLFKIITIGIVSMISYSAALQLIALWTGRSATATALSNLVFKIQYYWLVITEVATKALALTQSLLTFKIAEVRKAYLALMASMSLNPWGALVAIVVAAVAAYAAFSESNKDSQKIMEANLQVMNAVSEQTEKQKTRISDLVAIMKDENATIDQKKKALQELKKISDGYLDGLTLENIATAEGTRLINRYISSIDDLARAKALVDVKTKLNTQKIESDNKVLALSLEKKSNKNEGNSFGGSDGKMFGLGDRNKKEIQIDIDSEKENAKAIQLQLQAIDKTKQKEISQYQKAIKNQSAKLKGLKKDSKEFKELTQDIKNDTDSLNILIGLAAPKEDNASGGGFTPPGDKEDKGKSKKEKKDPNSTQEEINKLLLDNNQKYVDALLKQERQLEDDRIAGMVDGYEKELAIEALRYEREIDDLNSRKIHIDEIAKLDEESAKAKQSGDIKKYDALQRIKNTWIEFNKNLDSQVDQIAEGKLKLHNLKLATIEEKAATDNINKRKEKFEADKVLRETKFQQDLAALGNNEKAKTKLKKDFELSELAHQEEFLKELIAKFNIIVGKGKFDNIDLTLLSPEQVADFEKEAAKVGLTLAELINKKNALSTQGKVDDINALGIGGGSTDIFGFTPDNWVTFFGNLEKGKIGINEMVFAVSALTNMYSTYSDFLTSNENASLKRNEQASNKKKQNLKRQLDAGYINQVQYNRGVEKIDTDLAKQKAELEYKQAKRQKAIAAANIITSTAQAIIGIWAQFPKFDFGATAAIMSGVVGGLGALQLAQVLATPLPAKGFEQGLYPDYVKREQDGKVFQSTGTSKMQTGLFSKPRILVGEGPGDMPEMVIDKKAFSQISPRVKNDLINELRGIKGFENGYYNQANMRYEVPAGSAPTQGSSNDEILKMNMAVMSETLAVLKDLRENPLLALVSNKDFKSMKNMAEGIENYKKLIEKTKR